MLVYVPGPAVGFGRNVGDAVAAEDGLSVAVVEALGAMPGLSARDPHAITNSAIPSNIGRMFKVMPRG